MVFNGGKTKAINGQLTVNGVLYFRCATSPPMEGLGEVDDLLMEENQSN